MTQGPTVGSTARRSPRRGVRRRRAVVAGVVALAVGAGAAVTWRVLGPGPGPVAQLRIDQLQYDGTHNSYHQQLSSREESIARLASADAGQLAYGFPPIGDQLRSGVRVLELDLYADPDGGRYADPLIRRLAGLGRLPGLDAPGTKVLHIADADYRSSCATLVDCLGQVQAFDRAEPEHTPVFVLLEFKSSDPQLVRVGGVRSAPWDAAALATVDAEIAGVLGDSVITPDDVRRPGSTLEQSVLDGGWPTLDRSRGRTLFAMVNAPGPIRDAYLGADPDLTGRQVFPNTEPGQPDAAVLRRDDPGADADEIADLVRRGYLVRTRADDGPADPARLAAARASGAQLVSTDHPDTLGTADAGDDSRAEAPGTGLVRCGPVSAPARCVTALGARAVPAAR